MVIVNAWIVNNLSLVNIFGETGQFFYNINYMLNTEHLSLEYGSEEKGSSLCRCSILLGFIM